MKELLSKKFWQDVKKTFEDAQHETAPKHDELPSPPEKQPEEVLTTDIPPAA
jgi:hypothetical protein